MNEVTNMAGVDISYANQTIIHPLGLVAVLVLGIMVLILKRQWTVLPLLIMASFVSSAQRITILSLDFNLLRIMILFGVARLVFRREYRGYVWITLDSLMVLWVISSILIYTLQQGSLSAFVNRLGFGFDAFGMYFLFRYLIRDWQDVDRIIWGCIWVSIPVALLFLLENRTGRNLFSVFGGIPEITVLRRGRLRCQGAFDHPILAGCFWVSLMPLFVAHWWKSNKDRLLAVMGCVTSSIIVICCASNTPVMGILCGIIGGLMFWFRFQMRLVRWAILLALLTLHTVMQAPVWHLISRVSVVEGSTGWHRYNLINQAIMRFDEWFLLGTRSTAHWHLWGGLIDVTNQYILEGVRGGFLTLCLFVAVIAIAFREVGRLWRVHTYSSYRLALSWAMGVSLFVHCINFIGVAYFGQIWIVWYLILAMIGSLSILKSPVLIPKLTHTSAALKVKCYRNH